MITVLFRTDFIITASDDGHLKFWKKKHAEGIEFVKHFKCHLSKLTSTIVLFSVIDAFSGLSVNHNGTLLATVSADDKSIKIFDIINFDMINMIQLDFRPSCIAWVHQSADAIYALAIGSSENGNITIIDGRGTKKPIHVIEGIHSDPVKIIQVSKYYLFALISFHSLMNIVLVRSQSECGHFCRWRGNV